ncbi:uncharacterized protein HaLaN_15461 [Haematococcus lacustris]|uniref:Uncharacterized protein n=1 Tax=Haematococcus lacustris TaxID=44745 RepID=A0A699ZHU1_HAELA|nr:uncharacterized protein HaLaN_15461 [Haematococcus lacustris]
MIPDRAELRVDCTITTNDSLDLLAAFMGVKDEVEALTNRAPHRLVTLLAPGWAQQAVVHLPC